MKIRNVVILIGIVALGVGWYLFRPERLFVNKTVSETLPVGGGAAANASGEPQPIAQGRFHSVAHETKGTVAIYRLADGKRVLRFSEFETSNGPDVQVYLVAAPDSKDSETVKTAGFVHVGALKGNVGDQNYDLPADLDLAKYRSVTVWCRRFGVNFGTAPLAPAAPSTPRVLASGSFHGVAHETRGTATVYELPEGKRTLRPTDFQTSNGPDVQVYLVAAGDADDNDTVTKAGFLRVARPSASIRTCPPS